MAKSQVTDIPAGKVEQVVDDFTYEGCTEITRVRQDDGLWTVEANCGSTSDTGSPAAPTGSTGTAADGAAKPNYRSLVANGFFSSTPFDLTMKRSIRTNNPGALNVTAWQKTFPGYVAETHADAVGNVTSIYVTPEHGVGAWYHLLAAIYKFGPPASFVLSDLALRYAGVQSITHPAVSEYVAGWRRASGNVLAGDSTVSLSDEVQLIRLARAMFGHEAGQATPLLDVQILEGVKQTIAGTLPAN